MLNAIREGSKKSFLLKFIVFGFILMGLGGLVFMDVGSVFRGGLGSTTLARIGNEKVDIYEFQRLAERAVRAQNMTIETAHQLGFTNMLLEARIAQTLTDQTAEDLGVAISNKRIEDTLGRVLDTYRRDGQTRQETLNALLSSQGLNEATLIQQTQTQLKNAIIKNALTSTSLLIPDVTAEAFKTFQNEMRTIELFAIDAKQAPVTTEMQEEELRALYEREKMRFIIPESRDVSFIQLSADLFEDDVNITDKQIKDLYNERLDEFEIGERRYLKQAIVRDINQAEQILSAAKKSGNLKSATQKVTGSTSAYRDENFFDQEGLLDAVSGPVFNATELGFLELQQSALGWHVFELTKIEEPRLQDYEEVSDRIKQEALQDQTDNMLIDLLDRAEERLASGDNIQQIADALSLEAHTTEGLENSSESASQKFMMYGILETEAVLSELFALDQNTVTDPIETDINGFIMAEVTSIKPVSFQEFEDVREQLVDIWTTEEQEKALRSKALAVSMAINTEDDYNMQKAAAEFGSRVKTFKSIKRDGDIPSELNGDVLLRAFATPNIGNAQFVDDTENNRYIIFSTISTNFPSDINADGAPLDIQKLQIVRPIESTTQELFYQYMGRTRDVEVNEALLDMFFGSSDDS